MVVQITSFLHNPLGEFGIFLVNHPRFSDIKELVIMMQGCRPKSFTIHTYLAFSQLSTFIETVKTFLSAVPKPFTASKCLALTIGSFPNGDVNQFVKHFLIFSGQLFSLL